MDTCTIQFAGALHALPKKARKQQVAPKKDAKDTEVNFDATSNLPTRMEPFAVLTIY